MASILLLFIVSVFDFIAFALAVAAELKKSTAKIINEGTSLSCEYDSAIATGLGVGAFIFLFASQLLVMWASQSLCCGISSRRSGGSRVLLCVSCWLVFLVAEACLLAGSAQNAYHSDYGSILSNPGHSCRTLRTGVFAAGAAFILFTCILSELYYLSYSKANNFSPAYSGDTDIMMGDL